MSTRPALFVLSTCTPAWFQTTSRGTAALEGNAHVEGAVWHPDRLALRVIGTRVPSVSEQVPGTLFPSRCPERHIQDDHSFCLGLRRPPITTNEDAQRWWDTLWQFLLCQSVAEKTGIWPPGKALDHGDAGESHERALAISATLGIAEAYAAARLGEPSWITDRDIRLFGKDGRPINGRAPCPLGCRNKRNRIKLRCECEHRALVAELAWVEAERRRRLAAYWHMVRAAGTICCGRMRQCELKT